MIIRTRADIREYICKIEKDFPVSNWIFHDYHIWPILRIKLFFYLINRIENVGNERVNKQQSNDTRKQKHRVPITNKVKRFFSIPYYTIKYIVWLNVLRKKSIIFFGSKTHRVNYKENYFNKFFDVLITNKTINSDFYFFENNTRYSADFLYPKKVIFTETIFFEFVQFESFFRKFKNSKKNKNKFTEYDEFIQFLKKDEITHEFAINNTFDNFTKSLNLNFLPKVIFYQRLLKKIKPKKLYLLCYYSDLALVGVANKLNIETIEMQHGSQTMEHLCYGSWTNVPISGFELLPRKYWVWDQVSHYNMQSWISKQTIYSSFIGGNPWVDYWIKKEQDLFFDTEMKFILYTLQPNCDLDFLFPERILNIMENEKFQWYIKLHPRQEISKNDIVDFFTIKKRKLTNKIIDEENKIPLPCILLNSVIHVTCFSASTLEAKMLNIKTILINETGFIYYKELIEKKDAYYFDPKNKDFEENFGEVLNSQLSKLPI